MIAKHRFIKIIECSACLFAGGWKQSLGRLRNRPMPHSEQPADEVGAQRPPEPAHAPQRYFANYRAQAQLGAEFTCRF